MKKKIAIIGSGIAGLTLANFLYKDKNHDFMVYEKNESLPLDEGYGIQLSTNSIVRRTCWAFLPSGHCHF